MEEISKENARLIAISDYKELMIDCRKLLFLEDQGVKEWSGYEIAKEKHERTLNKFLRILERSDGIKFDEKFNGDKT